MVWAVVRYLFKRCGHSYFPNVESGMMKVDFRKMDRWLAKEVSEECRRLLRKAGALVEVNVIEDPRYFVADDVLG